MTGLVSHLLGNTAQVLGDTANLVGTAGKDVLDTVDSLLNPGGTSQNHADTTQVNPNGQVSGDKTPSQTPSQALIGRYEITIDENHEIQFVYTKIPDESGSSGSYLEKLQVYFSNNSGTFEIKEATGQLSGVQYEFGSHLSGTVSISATSDNTAKITYAYTLNTKAVPEQTTTFSLEPEVPLT